MTSSTASVHTPCFKAFSASTPSVYQMKVEEHLFWVSESESLKGCVGQGESSEAAIQEPEKNEREIIRFPSQSNSPFTNIQEDLEEM